jgi:DNA-binding HxlR family transcriptional regulator
MKSIKNDPPACSGNLMAMRDTLEVLGGKWKLLILHYLLYRENEANTFKKIEREIEGISAKMLSKELKDLEANQLINRKVIDSKPITVQYNITEYGKTANTIIKTLVAWGATHRNKILENIHG